MRLYVFAVMIGVRRWLGRLGAARSQMVGTVSYELRDNITGVLELTEVVATMADVPGVRWIGIAPRRRRHVVALPRLPDPNPPLARGPEIPSPHVE
jgi:hypothetical protein